jgi:hypothetical protein
MSSAFFRLPQLIVGVWAVLFAIAIARVTALIVYLIWLGIEWWIAVI